MWRLLRYDGTPRTDYGESKKMTEAWKPITKWQARWWKGILLPALSKDGTAQHHWENDLKITVMPDEFPTQTTTVNGRDYNYLPSIKTLGKAKMNILIEGSVAECHRRGMLWVSLPAKELRK